MCVCGVEILPLDDSNKAIAQFGVSFWVKIAAKLDTP